MISVSEDNACRKLSTVFLILFYAVTIKDVYEYMRVLLDMEGALAVAGCSTYLKEREMKRIKRT
jgi:hypothetical protein